MPFRPIKKKTPGRRPLRSGGPRKAGGSRTPQSSTRGRGRKRFKNR